MIAISTNVCFRPSGGNASFSALRRRIRSGAFIEHLFRGFFRIACLRLPRRQFLALAAPSVTASPLTVAERPHSQRPEQRQRQKVQRMQRFQHGLARQVVARALRLRSMRRRLFLRSHLRHFESRGADIDPAQYLARVTAL